MAASKGTLTFVDEFSRTSLNTGSTEERVWDTSYRGGLRTLPTNGELQLYLDDDGTVLSSGAHVVADPFALDDGVLTITARRDAADEVKGFGYTSGLINTASGFEFKYGYAEMRADLPAGKGLWPAFWLLRTDNGRLGEIDVMEVLGHDTDFLYQTVHHAGGTEKVVRANVADLSTGYHTYGVDWQPDRITFYLDGHATGSVVTPESAKAPMYVLANLAVGGYWPGLPDAGTVFPAEYKIDYIKVWQSASAFTPENRTGGAGSETMSGGDGADVLRGQGGNDTLLGAGGADRLEGGAGVDRLIGGLGNDTLVGGESADRLEGGRGNDTYVVEAGDVIVEFEGAGTDTVETALASYALGGNLEGLTYTGGGAFRGTGSRVDNSLTGGARSDTLVGGAGRDMLAGLAGADVLNGGISDDVLRGGSGNDTITGDVGADVFVFESGGGSDFVTDFRIGEDRLDVSGLGLTSLRSVRAAATNGPHGALIDTNGTVITLQNVGLSRLDGDDFIFSPGGAAQPTDSPEAPEVPDNAGTDGEPEPAGTVAGTSRPDRLQGTAAGDILLGFGGNDRLLGGVGDDTLDGGPGADRLDGGAGDDLYVLDNARDTVVEAARAGTDAVETDLARYALGGNLENLAYTGGGAFRGTGSKADNDLTGGPQSDTLVGGAGQDTLAGVAGADHLTGGLGGDVLIGGAGNDTLTGNGGADMFVFAGGSGDDFVTDFHAGEDRLDVAGLGLTDLGDVRSAASTSQQGNLVITAGDESITLQNVRLGDLTGAEFLF